MKKRNVVIIFIIFWNVIAVAQQTAQSYIKSIILKPLEPTNFSTILPLGKVVQLSFDDLEANQKEYQYKIEHMTFDWKPSNMLTSEYIDGFHQSNFQDYENSFNTLQDYTHYSVQIPNESIRIKKSGNYLISVLNEYGTVLFTRRLTYYENSVDVGISAVRSRNASSTKQHIGFTVHHQRLNINNPSQEIKVAVLQNNNWNTAITNLKPQFFQKNKLVYNNVNTSNFWGGNEYFNFDNKIISNSTLKIAKAVRKDVFHNYLHPNEVRKNNPYTYNPDINGQFLIRTLEGSNPNNEADYAVIHFTLNSEEITNKKVFVYGAFNNYETTLENEMTYDKNTQTYTASILLKQGFYNYTFATLDSNKNIDLTEINGSYYETENEYSVLVYYKPFGENYFRVIGVGNAIFNQQQ